MKLLHNHILVTFEYDKKYLPNGKELFTAERWVIEEGTEDELTKYDTQRDKRLVNPQKVKVILGNGHIPTGSRAFVYYGCYEIAQWTEYEGVECAIINAAQVFFLINDDGSVTPKNGIYLGRQVFSEGIKTESGIYLTPHDKVKEICRVELTNVPEESTFSIGDIVVTVDARQYVLKYDETEYIKLKETEIVGKLV